MIKYYVGAMVALAVGAFLDTIIVFYKWGEKVEYEYGVAEYYAKFITAIVFTILAIVPFL